MNRGKELFRAIAFSSQPADVICENNFFSKHLFVSLAVERRDGD